MINFSYLLGCRNCLNGGGNRHVYALLKGNEDEYKKMTEFEVMTKIERWRQESNNTCRFCGSTNVEILEIEVNDYPLYDFDRLVRECKEKNSREGNDANFFMLNLDKRGSQVKANVGGSQQVHKDFLESCLYKILNTLTLRPTENFKIHQNGNFLICISGGFNFETYEQDVKVERFRTAGLSKNEIVNQVLLLASKYGFSIENDGNGTPPKRSRWGF